MHEEIVVVWMYINGLLTKVPMSLPAARNLRDDLDVALEMPRHDQQESGASLIKRLLVQ